MDNNVILLALTLVVLVSYIFDLGAKHVRIPSVVLLILTGIVVRIGMDSVGWEIPLVNNLLPVIGTLGLILIVLEGALDLSLTKDKMGVMGRATASAAIGLAVTGALAASVFHFWLGAEWRSAWLYAVPVAVISSAVAIPAAANLSSKFREFVVYESSISDILGVLLFYALLDGKGGFGFTALFSVGNIIISTCAGVVFALALYWLINRIEAHVRFVPMIAGIAMLYAGGKLMGLAPLILVMVMGLILNNTFLLRRIPMFERIHDPEFNDELDAFKHLVAEATFIVRTFFFILLGYNTLLADLATVEVWLLASALLLCCFIPRPVLVRAFSGGKTLEPLVWFAPRGLITILLFLTIPESQKLASVPSGTLMLLVLMSALLLTVGVIRYGDGSAVERAEQDHLRTAEAKVEKIFPENSALAPEPRKEPPLQESTPPERAS